MEETQLSHSEPAARRLGRIDRYEIEGELGRGATGVVYRARDVTLGRPVAIKLSLHAAQRGSDLLERFSREAQAVARLRHPGILTVFGAGAFEGKPYLVLELLDGESLESFVQRERPVPRRVAEIARDVASALEHAHTQGVVHRDVKPENVFVERSGAVKLVDFGLARDTGSKAHALTVAGSILGTPAYMAPEQANGLAETGPLADVYGLGGVLYRALAGRPPFEAANLEGLLLKVLTAEPDSPRALNPRVHPDLETIALRCLAKEPARRYPSAGAVARELQRFLDGEPIEARPLGRAERAGIWARRNGKLVAALLALVLALAASATTTAVLVARTRERTREEEVRRAETARRLQAEVLKRARADARERLREGAEKEVAKDYEGAIQDFTAAIELDPGNPELYYSRAIAHRDHGELDAALADFDQVVAVDPLDRRARYYRGAVHELKDEWTLALADMEKVIELKDSELGARHHRAICLQHLGQLDLAVAEVDRYLELAPRNSTVLLLRFDLDVARGDLGAASDDIERSLALDRKGVLVWQRVAQLVAKLPPAEATAATVQLVQRNRSEPSAWKFLGDHLRGHPMLSIRAYDEGLRLDGTVVALHLVRGDVNRNLKRYSTAEVDYTAAVESDPRNPAGWLALADCYAKESLPETAGALLTKWVGRVPEAGAAWKARADFRLGRQPPDLEGALEDLDHWAALAPRDPAPVRARGLLRLRSGNRAGALADLEWSLVVSPKPTTPAQLNALAQLWPSLEDLRSGP